jgi:hypothetical protein
MAAVIGLEQSRSPADLVRVVDTLRERLRDSDDAELGRAFAEWVWRLAKRLVPEESEEPLPMRTTLEDMRMTLEERVAQWPKQWIQEGLEQGLAHERALLRRQAALRFGADTAEGLSEALKRIADPERLAEAGELLVRCDTGPDLLARVARLAERIPPDSH